VAYQLQQLRAVMDSRPDWQARLSTHVLAIETNIEARPDQCVAEARTLLEAVARTLCTEMGLTHVNDHDYPQQMRAIIKAVELRLDGHPRAADIKAALQKLIGGLNGAMGAIAQLSDIEGLRHGPHLDWPKLDRRHAAMLGGFCDTLVAFVIEAASAQQPVAMIDETTFESAPAFNDWLDEEHGPVKILEGVFSPSLILFTLDRQQYDSTLAVWQPDE
jgi:hypothetical protein